MNIDIMVANILAEGLNDINKRSLYKLLQDPSFIKGMIKYYEHRKRVKIDILLYSNVYDKVKEVLTKICKEL
jgi:hypothetical protein